MTTPFNRITITFLALGMGIATTHAAKAPLSHEELQNQSVHIVTGKVLKVTSKTKKSEVTKALGIHRDKIFRITIEVLRVAKGNGIATGSHIDVLAWQPVSRIPPLPGLQGHSSIPKKGALVTVHLKGRKEKTYEPLLPNGIVLEKVAR